MYALVGRLEQAEARQLIGSEIAAARAELEGVRDSRTLTEDVAAITARWGVERPRRIADALLRDLISRVCVSL